MEQSKYLLSIKPENARYALPRGAKSCFTVLLLSFVLPLCGLGQIIKTKIVDEGGSGPYKAIAVSEETLPDFVLYRPLDIGRATEMEGKLPILVWANGGCMNSSIHHERLLTEVASRGYLIVAIGELQMTVEERVHEPTANEKLLEGIDWMTEQVNDKNSVYYQAADLDKIASCGMSCGGAQVMAVAHDPRVKTYMMFNSGMGDLEMAGASKSSLKSLHGSIIYVIGGESDIAFNNAQMDFESINQVPVAFASLTDAGHGGTFAEEFGGSFARMTIDWLDWQLKGRDQNSSVFLKSELSTYPGWTMKVKNVPSPTEEDHTDDQKIAAIDTLLQSFVDQQRANCVAAFVAIGGDVVYHKAFGLKDVEKNVPATIDDYYVLFSQTKAITTVAFMTLVEQGLVAVDDPVSKYFPEIPDQVVTKVNDDGTYETRPVKTPMTFAHLMSHSSGLNAGLVGEIRRKQGQKGPDFSEFGKVTSDEAPAGQRSFGGNPASEYLAEEMLDLVKYPLGFDPGSEWNYHVSTNMLAYMVERISGKPLQQYVQETILEPLGMKDTDWFYTPDRLARFVKPYSAVEGQLVPGSTMFAEGAVNEKQTYAEGAIGLNGPIEDYAKFCQMLLNEGAFNGNRILQPETIAQMVTINRLPEENAGGEGFQFGLGFQLANEKNKHIEAVSNSAFWWGGLLGTEYIIDPERNLIALFYINMYKRDGMYHEYLEKVYELVDD